ncbi:diacylglycerol kinase family protein [Daejeonella sp.]|uniref:diacylglycerol kinase n=1 Tax=Daejeonella sp. TaxID=2805397 RepID=UPI0025BC19F5|nr:diacylglycerol kinase family protein [Daejeonella sp.]
MKRFLKGFYFAFNGIKYSFKTQLNFRVHAFLGALALIISYILQIAICEWIWIIAAISLVLIVELINTAIETLVDLVSPEFNPKAGLIKDISAAAVLISAIFAFLVGCFIFLPKLFHAL